MKMAAHRLGVAVKVLGAPLRSHDGRRWQNRPHLSISLAYVRDMLAYLHRQDIHFYRLAGHLAPYATHPALPHFHNQIEACATELAEKKISVNIQSKDPLQVIWSPRLVVEYGNLDTTAVIPAAYLPNATTLFPSGL